MPLKYCAAIGFALFWYSSASAEPGNARTFSEFAGLCVHTVQFRPDLYRPVTKLLRDYHPVRWDLGEETGVLPEFPFAKNRVDWSKVYGPWKAAGYRIDASLMFDDMPPGLWKDPDKDGYAYGKAFAQYFGPSGKALVEAAEIGNEPGKYDDATYRKLFTAMAKGLREGDPKLQIVTCAAEVGASGEYAKSVEVLNGLDPLWDVLNVHIYPQVEGWPTWRRSYPEDPKTKFLEKLQSFLEWRDAHAKGKPIWLTEFGYDASTKKPGKGTFERWVGVSDEQQAIWTARAYLLLASTQLDRAYLYFFNDKDEPQMHGSSGLTRNFQPKPAFHAVAFLQAKIGDCRLARADHDPAKDVYTQDWVNSRESAKHVLIAWRATGPGVAVDLPVPQDVAFAEELPLAQGAAKQVKVGKGTSGRATVEVGELPVFIEYRAP